MIFKKQIIFQSFIKKLLFCLSIAKATIFQTYSTTRALYTEFVVQPRSWKGGGGDHEFFEQKFIHERPVIPFNHLGHFRETAVFIIAAKEEYHETFNRLLTQNGFKNLVFISDDFHEEVEDKLNIANRDVNRWYLKEIFKKLNALEHRVEEQNEICAVNTKAFSEYKNAFRDKEVVIVGTGPSLQFYKPIPNAIHIGLNRAWKREDIPLDYLFMIDGLANNRSDIKIEEGFDKVHETIFVGRYPLGNSFSYASVPEKTLLERGNIRLFFVGANMVSRPIYPDIRYHFVADFSSVSFNALHFALFTYPKKIYLVGLDTTSTGHFYADSEKDRAALEDDFKKAVLNCKVGYARMKMFAQQYYPDTEIMSINPIGLRGLFRDIYTGNY